MNVIGSYWCYFNTGSGNGLVPSGNKPLPEPTLTLICGAIWCRQAKYYELDAPGVKNTFWHVEMYSSLLKCSQLFQRVLISRQFLIALES